MSSKLVESNRRKRRFKPFNVVALDKDRQQLEELRIREAYDRERTANETTNQDTSGSGTS